jgi:hypothetical protein
MTNMAEGFKDTHLIWSTSLTTGVTGALGLRTLMGERRQDQICNMTACISKGIIAQYELIARKT